MVHPRDIIRFAEDIARQFKPARIILFGSYAYGTPTDDSDVDLLVVMPYRGPSIHKAVRISLAPGYRFSTDLLVRSPTEIRKRLSWNDLFIKEIVEKGIILHDASSEGMGRQG
jgi:uncharacterized protein